LSLFVLLARRVGIKCMSTVIAEQTQQHRENNKDDASYQLALLLAGQEQARAEQPLVAVYLSLVHRRSVRMCAVGLPSLRR
jgi:hypothetical protein